METKIKKKQRKQNKLIVLATNRVSQLQWFLFQISFNKEYIINPETEGEE